MGYHPDLFWDLSPAEYYLYEEAYQQRMDAEFEVNMTIAYNSAKCVMNDKAPTLDKLLGRKAEIDEEDVDDDELNAQLAKALMEFM